MDDDDVYFSITCCSQWVNWWTVNFSKSWVNSLKPAVLSVCLRKERWGSGCAVPLHLGLSGLVFMLILQGPHNKAPGLALIFLWVHTHTHCHTDLYTDQRPPQIQAPNWPPLSRNQNQDQRHNCSPLSPPPLPEKESEGEEIRLSTHHA